MTSRIATAIVLAALALAGGGSFAPAGAGQPSGPPLLLPVEDVHFRIVGATFVSELQGTSTRFQETRLEKYRGLVLTVEIKKTPGEQLTLVAQDLALHYRYGTNSDVASCYGLSTFSKEEDTDRAMNLYRAGWGRTTTGLSTTKLGVVYVDMFFQNMEPETSDLFLLVAQPVGAYFKTSGWK